jgi:hypothetical protein
MAGETLLLACLVSQMDLSDGFWEVTNSRMGPAAYVAMGRPTFHIP